MKIAYGGYEGDTAYLEMSHDDVKAAIVTWASLNGYGMERGVCVTVNGEFPSEAHIYPLSKGCITKDGKAVS